MLLSVRGFGSGTSSEDCCHQRTGAGKVTEVTVTVVNLLYNTYVSQGVVVVAQ